jgi:hypothetical protein
MKEITRYLARMAGSMAAMFLAGMANAAQDIAGNVVWYRASIFPQPGEGSAFWGPQGETWANKWAIDEGGHVLPGVERFFLSSTALVWLTDLWHAAKSAMLICFQIGALLYRRPEKKAYYLIDLVALKLAFGLGFWIGRKTMMIA